MGWVDTHCHLQLDERPAEQLLARATNVDWMVVPGVDADSSQRAIDLVARFSDRLRATAGLHPHDASRWPAEEERIRELAGKACAIGETGLDFYRNLSPLRDQLAAFRSQVELAARLELPLVVHCRDAFTEVYDELERSAPMPVVVLHCWTGGPRWTRRFRELGCWFSFAGPVAFETGETVRRGAAEVPPERALVETDTPYLSPPPFRDQPNEPARVELVGAALARVWGRPVEVVAEITSRNAAAVFGP
jgi:TatD DNase family protein